MNKLMKEFLCVALVVLVFATLAACSSPAAKPEATQAPQPAAEENSAPAEAEESAEAGVEEEETEREEILPEEEINS